MPLPDPPDLPVDPLADRLILIYRAAERELDRLIERAANRGAAGTARYFTNQQAQVVRILAVVDRKAAPLRPLLAARAYRTGVSAVDRVLHAEKAFSGAHAAAIEVVAANLEANLRYAEERIGRAAEDVLRRIALEEVGLGITAGLSPRQQRDRLVERLRLEGVTAFIDRRGRRWRLGVYAAMVTRTTTREAVSVGMKNRLVEHGKDLVKISEHRRSCPICLPYQGKTFSLTGARSPEYEEIDQLPPFHPNCRHVLLPAGVEFEEMEKALGLGPGPDPVEPEAVAGTSIASSLRGTRLVRDDLKRATDAIDAVHSVPEGLPEIPVVPDTTDDLKGAWAGLVRDRATMDTPKKIEVTGSFDLGPKTDAYCLIHEIGHYLDLTAFDARPFGSRKPNDYFASNTGTEFADLLAALNRSGAIRRIREREASNPRQIQRYLLEPAEMFARAYAQWVATRSGDQELLDCVARQDDFIPGARWAEDEFAEIAAALDTLFERHGWLKK